MARRQSAVSYQEESALSQLTVKIIKASNIPWADWTSNADCYVCLWLPTATNSVPNTSTISNNSCPVWNETFEFTISNKVKNVIHLTLHDEDAITKNDLLSVVAYDVGNVNPGETKTKSFCLDPTGEQTLEVEFTVKEIPHSHEKIVTNGVLVCREMSCLEISVDKQRIPENLLGGHLCLSVKDSCEKKDRVELRAAAGNDHTYKCKFHCIRKWDPELIAQLEGTDDQCLQVVPVKTLPLGQEQKIHLSTVQARPLEVKLKAKDCTDKMNIRLGFGICEEEIIFRSKRKKLVADALKKVLNLDRDLQEHEVPVIGIAATGGGVRAMISLLGSLIALKKLNLLDCVSYITGTSGSTWTLSKLYADANWSQKDLTKTLEDVRRNVTKSKMSAFSFDSLAFYKSELSKREEMGYKTSFSDLWGLAIESMMYDKVNESKLTDQRKALCNGQNPLPLYLSMNVKPHENSTLDFKEWCEFSPYEVGLLKYGAFIRSEDFGSEFFMGRKTKVLPESRICFLLGMWSNIFSVNLLDAWYAAVSSENFWHRFTRDNVLDLGEEEALERKKASACLDTRLTQPAGEFSQRVRGVLTNRPLDGELHNFLRGLQMHSNYVTENDFCTFDGTELDNSPNNLTPCSEDLCLVDCAYYINASFPPLLRQERKVDMIMSFDYGLSDKFKSVVQTEEYCTAHKLFFPKIEVTAEDKQNPKECYVFADCEYPDFPTIMHFPLVNDTFKKYKQPGVERETDQEKEEGNVPLSGLFSPYKVFRLTYGDEDLEKLINLTEYNVLNNVEVILQTLRNIIECKQKRSSSTARL
ncbi:cytosolic phospholipase A2 delta-like isoform X2 [Rana temporaria]|uniref:cytosolic phospholipase A2 delta-like isoform X2 n=1 Tax=Rana temporaria TaxID=8407 RepID=UPI001AADF54B|nr:cytosolic phospholipase A2 delta-like isoform X2 [Rana temporaria]